MYAGDLILVAIVVLLAGLIMWVYTRPRTRRRWQGNDDNGSHMRPERNEDGQGGGGLD